MSTLLLTSLNSSDWGTISTSGFGSNAAIRVLLTKCVSPCLTRKTIVPTFSSPRSDFDIYPASPDMDA